MTGPNIPAIVTTKRPSRHCLQRLRQYFPRLSAAQQGVAEYILQHPSEALNSSVHEIAAHCNTSPSTIVRLAKDIGFDGIKEMKLALAQEIGTLLPNIEAQHEFDDDGHLREILDNTILGLQETAASMDFPALQLAVDALAHARHVDVYGASTSFLVGMDLVEKLKRLGIYASSYDNSYMQAISSAGLGKGDVAIAVTYSGETRSVVENLAMAQEQGATTIALTNFQDSTVVQVADIIIPTSVTRHLLPDGSLGGRIAQLFAIDLLFIELFASDPERFQAAFHKYNQILLKKISKSRDRLGLANGGSAGSRQNEQDDTDQVADSEESGEEGSSVMKLVGGNE